MKKSPSLLIYIPSYNRWDNLLEKIKILLPQIDGVTSKLCISDNNSTDTQYEKLKEYEQEKRIEVNRLPVNTGIAGNILHAFEVTFGDFVWILSDDDIIYPDSVKKIEKELSSDLDLLYLFAGVKGERRIDKYTSITTKQIFFEKFANLSMTGLISANVYNKNKMCKYAGVGYGYAHTLFPHTAMFFSLLAKSDPINIKTLKGVTQWRPGAFSYDYNNDIAWVNFLDLSTLIGPEYRLTAIKKFLSDWALRNYLPITFSSGNFLKYIYYSCVNWRIMHFFVFYLTLFPFYKVASLFKKTLFKIK